MVAGAKPLGIPLKGFRSINEEEEQSAQFALGIIQAQEAAAARGAPGAFQSEGRSPSQTASADEIEAGVGFRGASGSNAPAGLAIKPIASGSEQALRASSRSNLLDTFSRIQAAQEQIQGQPGLLEQLRTDEQNKGLGLDRSLQQIRAPLNLLARQLKPLQEGQFGQEQILSRNFKAFNNTAAKIASQFNIDASAASDIILQAIQLEPGNPGQAVEHFFNKGKENAK